MPSPPLAPSLETRSYSVFLSSGSDAADLRDRVNGLVDVVNQIFVTRDARIRIDVRRWENHAPQRSSARLNTKFVAEAKQAHLTIALLFCEIRPGTLEELTAVLNETTKEVAVLWFRDPEEQPTPALAEFFEKYRDALLYAEAGPPDTDGSWIGIVRLLVDFIVRIFHDQIADRTEIFNEVR